MSNSPELDDGGVFARLEPPWTAFEPVQLGPEYADELATVRDLWFACGYRPGIAAYLNFFLLTDFIALHDRVFPPRFASFRSMARSFYETDVFVRAVTDSGAEPSGGIAAPAVRELLAGIMARHRVLDIPLWMMTYFGFSLVEAVELQCAPLTAQQQRWHLAYMAKTYRLMGMPFSANRELMTAFARGVERAHVGLTPQLERHAANILLLGEMVGAPSAPAAVLSMLPEASRAVFAPLARRVRPGPVRRVGARLAGRLLMKRAVGSRREPYGV